MNFKIADDFVRFKMIKTPRQEFLEMMIDNNRSNGLDELSSKIIATLFLEPSEISLEDLAKKTGYSLSAISTSLKFMENSGFIHKHKKPHSKKIFLSMEKRMLDMMLRMLKRKQEGMIQLKQQLPVIIDAYKKNKESKQELMIIENYYQDILFGEKIIKDSIDKMEKRRT